MAKYAIIFNEMGHRTISLLQDSSPVGLGKKNPSCKRQSVMVDLQKGNLSGRVLVKVGNKLLR